MRYTLVITILTSGCVIETTTVNNLIIKLVNYIDEVAGSIEISNFIMAETIDRFEPCCWSIWLSFYPFDNLILWPLEPTIHAMIPHPQKQDSASCNHQYDGWRGVRVKGQTMTWMHWNFKMHTALGGRTAYKYTTGTNVFIILKI